MRSLLPQPVFRIGDVRFLWEDVVLSARRREAWEPFEQRCREGVACQTAQGGRPDPALEDELSEAVEEFRYDHDLESAADTERWLSARGVTTEQWRGHLRREVLRARMEDRLPRLLKQPLDPAAVDEAIRIALLCDDEGMALAGRAAGEAALADTMGEPLDFPTAAERDQAVIRGVERYREQEVGPDEIAREISRRQLEWVRIECEVLEFGDQSHAEEAALCLRDDGLDFEEVAKASHVEVQEVGFYLDELASDQRSKFQAAKPGDLIGPLTLNESHAMFRVVDKVLPTPEDETLCERAEADLLQRARQDEGTTRVHWEITW